MREGAGRTERRKDMWRYGIVILAVGTLLLAGCEEKKAPVVPPKPVAEATGDEEILDSIAKTVEKGAAFLISKQQPDGSFGSMPEQAVGITGLAVSALANCSKELREKHKTAIEKGCKFLLSKQQPDGSILDPGQGLVVYKTSVSILALCSADRTAYADWIKKAQDYVVRSQYWSGIDASDVKFGGWGYNEKEQKPDADLSNTQLALEALESSGLPKDHPAWERAVKFVSRSQNWTETNDVKVEKVKILNDGGFTYGPAKTRAQAKENLLKDEEGNVIFPSYASMTYAGFKSLLYANVNRNDSRVQAAWRWICQNYTLDENRGMGSRQQPATTKQGLYYFYRAFGKALLTWGERTIVDTNNVKHDWCEELSAKLASLQRADGSWINEADRWFESLPELVTSYSLDALNMARLQVEKSK
jgi:squalene-hopene/tetraprenyl-beta-curcumene cyclase